MPDHSPKLGLGYVAAGQAQKHVTVNEALRRLDAAAGVVLATVSAADPPAEPVEGRCHLVPPGATGAWAGQAGRIAAFVDAAWIFLEPWEGMVAPALEGGTLLRHAGAHGFVPALAVSPAAATVAAEVLEEDLDLAGPFVESLAVIPDRAIVLGVSTRTLEAVTGAASYDCGIAGEPAKFGGLLGAAEGAVNIGVVGPTAVYAPTPVRISANGGDFTGGRLRIAIHLIRCGAPAA